MLVVKISYFYHFAVKIIW